MEEGDLTQPRNQLRQPDVLPAEMNEQRRSRMARVAE